MEHDDGGPVRRVVQGGERGMPVQPGHVQVEQQHVRAGGGDDVYRLLAVSGFAGDLDVWFLAEQVAQPVPDDAVVVGDHHADRHGTGTRTVGAAPRPGCAVDVHGAAEFGDPVPDVGQPGAGARGGRIESGAGVAHGQHGVPVLAGHRHGKQAGVAVPDGVGACLLGDAQQGVLSGADRVTSSRLASTVTPSR